MKDYLTATTSPFNDMSETSAELFRLHAIKGVTTVYRTLPAPSEVQIWSQFAPETEERANFLEDLKSQFPYLEISENQ